MRLIWSLMFLVCTSLWASEERLSSPLDEAIERAIFNSSTAPIQSLEELESHMNHSSESAFGSMSAQQQALFLDSAVFTEHGLASFYMPAFRGLSVSEAARILALFGWQENISALASVLEIRDELDTRILAAQPQSCEPPTIPYGTSAVLEINDMDGSVQSCSPCALPVHICARRASCVVRTHYVCNICTC